MQLRIHNAKIQKVTVDFSDSNTLAATVEFVYPLHRKTCTFHMLSSTELHEFMKLREYVDAEKVQDMNDKIIRLVWGNEILQAFGHPLEDKFIYLNPLDINAGKEFTESNLKVKLDEKQ